MNDPLDALSTPVTPAEPDPAFARALRARLERALLTTEDPPMTTATAQPAALRDLTPYLAVTDARAAVDFYVAAFGATRRAEPIVMPDGRIGHVEVALGDSVLMLADEFPEMGLAAPATRGGVSQSLRLEVPDPDAVVAAALAAGGIAERPVTDSPYGRGGVVLDPSGHRWMVSAAPARARPGDVVHASLWTPDVDRTARFLQAVLGWETVPDHDGRARRVAGLGLGIVGGPARGDLFLCYAVADVDAAVAVVRAAGGTADEPHERPHGRVADCVDDQGLPFAVHAGDGPAVIAPAAAAFRVPDGGRARAFYGTVLGWGFEPGEEPGSWTSLVAGTPTRPRTVLSGGHATASIVPTWDVPDLDAAVAAVRAAGGRAAADGRTAECADDQGAVLRLHRP